MRLRRTSVLVLMIMIFGTFSLPVLHAETTGNSRPVPVRELEDELTGIEKELTGLEKEIDTLLEDLIDPKITSLSVFFSAQSARGQVPVSIQVSVEGEPLISRAFDETDRLVLVRGGAVEVYSGIAEPVSHNLTVECFLASGEPQGQLTSTGKTVFKFKARRAAANFLEITLGPAPEKKPVPYSLSARHWSKGP